MEPKRLAGMDWVELEDCARAYVATGLWTRLVGLAWLDELPEGCGLLIPWCRSVHTFGMRFALDVDFLGADGRVLRCRGAVAVLERQAR